MRSMNRAEFERLAEEALAELPARYRALLENIVVIVEDRPRGQRRRASADEELLLG